MGEAEPRDILWRPGSPLADLGRYALAGAVVASLAGGVVLALGRVPDDGQVASETDEAVLIDLPPALASSTPASEANAGPQQQAAEAAAPVAPAPPLAEATPDTTDRPPKADPPTAPKPPEPAPPIAPDPVVPTPPPSDPPPEPLAETPPLPSPPEKPVAPPVAAASAQEEVAPAGSQVPVKDAEPIDSDVARRRAARAISRWQQAMLVRLEGAKGSARSSGQTGTVTVAFAINRQGQLTRSRVARGSGLLQLDREALALLARAAPFPAPPAGAGDPGLSFTVPIVFAHRR